MHARSAIGATFTDLTIRQATRVDLETVRGILLEAAHWLRASGRELWRDEELTEEALTADLESGHYYLGFDGRQSAGVLRFRLSDPLTWPDLAHDDAVYIHRLAVRRKYSGGRASSALLRWAVDRSRALGKRYLRLDCDSARPKLRNLYEAFGFVWHCDRQVGSYHVARYQYLLESEGSK